MSNRCSFCQHSNPPDAKYCNECGGTLGLKPCHRCDAVNDAHAACCHVCGVALGDAVDETIATTKPTALSETSSSVLHALETIEADLATLEQAEKRRAEDRHHARDVAKALHECIVPVAPPPGPAPAHASAASAPARAFASHIGDHVGVRLREYARRPVASHALRPLLVASLVLAGIGGIARSDQQSSHVQQSAAASLGNSAFIADAGETGMIPSRHRTDMPTRGMPMFRAASSSPRGMSGIIANEPIAAEPDSAPPPTPAGDAPTAFTVASTPQTPATPVASPPRSAEVVAAAAASTAKPKPVARRPKAAAPAHAATKNETHVASAPAALLAVGETAPASAEAVPYPVAPRECADSVAALGLCRDEGQAHGH